jgi:hypothetical protein
MEINNSVKIKGSSTIKALLAIVTHQCINLVAAGIEIMTVKVLNSIRVVCASPTIYIWCPHTKKPKKAIVYIEYIKLALAETRLRK